MGNKNSVKNARSDDSDDDEGSDKVNESGLSENVDASNGNAETESDQRIPSDPDITNSPFGLKKAYRKTIVVPKYKYVRDNKLIKKRIEYVRECMILYSTDTKMKCLIINPAKDAEFPGRKTFRQFTKCPEFPAALQNLDEFEREFKEFLVEFEKVSGIKFFDMPFMLWDNIRRNHRAGIMINTDKSTFFDLRIWWEPTTYATDIQKGLKIK